MEHYFETVLIEQCAPTLAGVKPASLFRYEPQDMQAYEQTVLYWTEALARRGLTLRIVKQCSQTNSVLFYLYRKIWVQNIIMQNESQAFLASMGYHANGTLEEFLQHLSSRFCLEQEFPHEIGLFLGYPLCDVVGFVEHKGRNYTYCGQWKCYGDAQEAKKRFAQLKKCTSVYKKMYENGTPILQLIVAA